MLLHLGFLSVHWTDIIDIVVVALLFHRLYLVMRGTIAMQIFIGLLLIFGASFLAEILELRALTWLLHKLTDIWVIAFIILFQPELRRLLLMLGRGRFSPGRMRGDLHNTVVAIADACAEMSAARTGALIIVTRSTGIRMIIETGTPMHAEVSKHLLLSIFNTKAPLHDGAVVVNGSIIEAARCTLPLTQQLQIDGYIMGMRHRSAVGISEQADVIAIVVSEETGMISIARDGRLRRDLTHGELIEYLTAEMRVNVKGVFESVFTADPNTPEEVKG
jgi:diadenylate cyclase